MFGETDWHPGHTKAWYDAYILRIAHYLEYDGDMSGAPDLPEE